MSEQKHLSGEQIDRLMEVQIGAAAGQMQDGLLKEAQDHLATCATCQKLVAMYQEFHRTISRVGRATAGAASSDCPSNHSLNELAAGLMPVKQQGIILDHIVGCDHCGALLRDALEVFETREGAEEKAVISALRTAEPRWQRQLASMIANRNFASPRGSTTDEGKASAVSLSQRSRRLLPHWAYGVAAIALMSVGTFGWIWWHSSPRYAARLLAQAYSQQRTIELRFGTAEHGPVHLQRGADTSRLRHPASLLEAEALVARRIVEHPDDPLWLQSRGQIDLLEGNNDAALESLDRAVELSPRSAELLTDLATANFQVGEERKQTVFYGRAVDLLGQALAIKPDYTVALFNRAIAEERLSLHLQAAVDWKRYLELDPTSGWADEARERLGAVQRTIRDREKNGSQNLMNATQFSAYLRAMGRGNEKADLRVDDYTRLAMTNWISRAFVAPGGDGASREREEVRDALLVLGNLAKHRHGDSWLGDLLKGKNERLLSKGSLALSDALSAEDQGKYNVALERARLAESIFQKAQNSAGLSAARVEEIAALRFTDQIERCARLAPPLIAELKEQSYVWLGARLGLEYAICEELLGDGGNARRVVTRVVADTERNGYPTTHLRALTVLVGLDRSAGNTERSWQDACSGLSAFWLGSYPSMRGYSLQAQMELLAEDGREWFLQVTILQEAMRFIDTDQDLLLRAVAHDRLARAATAGGMHSIAAEHFGAAEQLFALCPQDDVTRSRRADAQIWWARADIMSGALGSAEDRLGLVQHELLKSSYGYALVDFLQARAELAAKRGDFSGARKLLASAFVVTEKRLASAEFERDRIVWDRENSSVYRLFVACLLREGRGSDALEMWEWYRASPLRAGKSSLRSPEGQSNLSDLEDHPFKPATIDLKERLRSLNQETVVSYALLPGGSVVWAFDDRGVEWRWISEDPKQLQARVKHFWKLCGDPGSDISILRSEGRRLYELLVAPIAGFLRSERTITFEGDGVLGQLPVQVLVDERDRYLGERFDVNWSPGFEYQLDLRPSQPFSTNSSALVVATSEGTSTQEKALRPLPDVLEEGRQVGEKFAGAQLLVEKEATLSQLRISLPRVSVFHFAGHAASGLEVGGLRLRDSIPEHPTEVLSASEIEGMSLKRLDLAVLSACSTELAANEGIVHPASIARAFLRAGVPHVVASRWVVDSESAAAFMDDFYRSLLKGNSVSRSVRLAAEGLRMRANTSHPFYWAAFNSFGKG